jgi:hypothetical protein
MFGFTRKRKSDKGGTRKEETEPTTTHDDEKKEDSNATYHDDDENDKVVDDIKSSCEEDKEEEEVEIAMTPQEKLEEKRQKALERQKSEETKALGNNTFCKQQRVQYFHKASGKTYDAVVVAVHLDDGIDRPYFTIRYFIDESASNPVEKQTTPDRLSYVPFDEAATYDIIASKIVK